MPAWVDADHPEQRILEASVVVPTGAAITGWAALRWLRSPWFDGTDASGKRLPVTLLVSSHDVRPQPGIVGCGEGTGPANIRWVDGVPVTVPAWTTAFMMRRAATPEHAVLAFDMAAYSDLVSIDEVAAVLAAQSSWTGVPQARRAIANACENAWSPAEVFMRLAWQAQVEGVRLLANVPVFDRCGRHIGTPDLVDVTAGVVGEYDGIVHLGRQQRRADRTRDELFTQHGLEVVRWMSGDRTSDFLGRLHRAYRRAADRTGTPAWTTDAPPGWISTSTVAARRMLTEAQRARLLRYRVA